MDAAVFGRFLAETRRAQDLTQAELAGRIGVTDKAVSRWERGVGFPDIQTLEPLAAALGLTVPELMRSRRDEAPQPLSDRDVTELLQSAVTMAPENQRQDRTATLLAILVTVLAGTPVFLTRHANLSGAYFFGAMAATAAVGAYLYLRNREDRASRRIYGCFLLAGTGLTVTHVNLLDGPVEGGESVEDRIFSVQYHPESAPGPQDSTYLFDQFLDMMKEAPHAQENRY